jgi:hypothetical protein
MIKGYYPAPFTGAVINSLTTGGTTNALSAEQGKVLKGLVDGLDEAKQDELTFDDAPTEGSTAPVTSGGVFTALALRLLASEFGANWWSTFQDKATALPDAVEGVITLVNRKRYYIETPLTDASTFTLAFPSSGAVVGDEIELYFMTGATVPAITWDTSNTVDISTPLYANRNYEVNAKFRPLTDSAGTVANGWDVAIRESTVTAV